MRTLESLKYVTLDHTNSLDVTLNKRDLVILKDSDRVYSSANSILVVNGIACYTTHTPNMLKIYNAGLLSNPLNLVRDVVALDFSRLGKVHKYKLSSCRKILVTGLDTDSNPVVQSRYVKSAQTFESYRKDMIGIVFELPKGAKIGIPVLCLAGRMFYPVLDNLELFRTVDGYGVFFSISRVTLEGIFLNNLMAQNPSWRGFNMGFVNLDEFLDDIFTENHLTNTDPKKDSMISFVAMIETEEDMYASTTKSISSFDRGIIRFPAKSYGMLVNKHTREMKDYVRIPYKSETHVMLNRDYSRYMVVKSDPTTYTNPAVGHGFFNYNESDIHNPYVKDLRRLNNLDDYVLLDIMWYVDYDELEPDEEEGIGEKPFRKINFFVNRNQRKIPSTIRYLRKYLQPIEISLTLHESSIVVHRQNDIVSGTYVLSDDEAEGIERIWEMEVGDVVKYTIQYNLILQGWVIAYPDGKVIYQSSLSATWDAESSSEDAVYYNPWDANLFWFKPINRL